MTRERFGYWEIEDSPAVGMVEASREDDWVILTAGWGPAVGEVYMPRSLAAEIAAHLAVIAAVPRGELGQVAAGHWTI